MAKTGNVLRQEDNDYEDLRIVPGAFDRPGASDWDEGSYLEAGAGAAGIYSMHRTMSVTESGGAG